MLLAVGFVMLAVGCGSDGGVAEGARVNVYVTAPLCSGAEAALVQHGREAGDLRLRVVCLPSGERSGKLDLAQIGANARRATEDSSAIAYIGERTNSAARFSAPILEPADIPQYAGITGTTAMRELLKALEEGRVSPRGNL